MGRRKVALARQLAGFAMQVVICDVDTVGRSQGFCSRHLPDGTWEPLMFNWSCALPTC